MKLHSTPTFDPARRRLLQLGIGSSALSLVPSAFAAGQQSNAHIVIVGAGAAGLSIASRLSRSLQGAKLTLVGARKAHYYQPGFTLVASGLWDEARVITATADWLPASAQWIEADAREFDPQRRQVKLSTGQVLNYDLLVVASGCQLNYTDIDGMSRDLVGQEGIGSVYAGPDQARATNAAFEQLVSKGEGRALFTLCETPLKCAGAPLKMTFTSLSRLEDSGRRGNFDVGFVTPFERQVFSVPVYNEFVLQRWQEQQVSLYDQRRLTAVDAGARQAQFTLPDGRQQVESYDYLHVVPPMSAPDAVRRSELAWQEGPFAGEWLEVDQYSLQHRRYPEIFGIGDVVGTPFGKTAASVKKQAPVVEQNILDFLAGRELSAQFNGYTSCPLITSIGRAILAEFGYGGKLMPTFPFIDPLEESWAVWVMKEKMLQPAYYAMLEGQV